LFLVVIPLLSCAKEKVVVVHLKEILAVEPLEMDLRGQFVVVTLIIAVKVKNVAGIRQRL
jgi:hypothetical protein